MFISTRILLNILAFQFFIFSQAFSWGSAGHRLINLKSVMHLPPAMSDLKQDSLFYQSYSSAPDFRKDYTDTSFFAEANRHFIDLENYPDFHSLPHSLDSMIMLYSRTTVRQN